jgi:hypothetical protein
MRLSIDIIPDEIINEYNLRPLVSNGYVYIETRKGMYGLPQAGILVNKLLTKRLALHGYASTAHTHCLCRHKTRPIGFGIKYVRKEHANHLYHVLTEHYKASTGWDGNLYCGVTLKWDYQAHAQSTYPCLVTWLQRSKNANMRHRDNLATHPRPTTSPNME